MNAPRLRELHEDAPVAVPRKKPNLLRVHCLTGALVFGLVGLMGYSGFSLYKTEIKLAAAKKAHAELASQVTEAEAQNKSLKRRLDKAADAETMELMAKAMGFVYPNETVYQKSPNK